MVLAYFAYRKNMPLALHSALVPLFREKRVHGALGHTVDTFGVVVHFWGLQPV